MRYHVRVNDAELEIEVDGERFLVDGAAIVARLETVPDSPMHVVTIGSGIHTVLARRGAQKGEYDIRLAGHRFAVAALDQRALAIRALAGKGGSRARPASLIAPMPGLVVRVNVAAGDAVRAGQGLVVIEAMKMENELRAAADGVVKRVAVAAGTAVEKGTLLLEME